VSTPIRITSRQHPVVREFRQAAARTGTGSLVLLDGEHLLKEALAAGVPIRVVLSSESEPSGTASEAADRGATVYTCTRAVLDAASPVRTPSGLVALAEWTPSGLATAFSVDPALVVGLVDVQDPGNVGSAIRSADALGATGVVAIGATASPSGWKVLRGSMGSAFRLPVVCADLPAAVAAARTAGASVLATTPTGTTPLCETDLRSPVFVLFGHEGGGLAGETLAQADARIAIPMRTGVESLNVAVAAALVLDEARRQRERRP